MKLILLFAAFVLTCRAQTYQECRARLVEEEGYRNEMYIDSLGYPTIGIGHRYDGSRHWMSDREIERLFARDLSEACRAATSLVPNYSRHSMEVRLMLVSLTFNLGRDGFADFRHFRSALAYRNYHLAAAELRKSFYYRQLPNRVEAYARVLEAQ